jgi:hypothetical protein
MRGRQILVQIGLVAIVLFLFISPWSPLRSFGESVWLEEVPNTDFVCDGRTNAWDQVTSDQVTSKRIPACAAWGIAILNEHLEYPDGLDATNVKRLEMEQAWWGFVDQCTVTAYVRRMTVEQEVPCWDDSLSEPSPY